MLDTRCLFNSRPIGEIGVKTFFGRPLIFTLPENNTLQKTLIFRVFCFLGPLNFYSPGE